MGLLFVAIPALADAQLIRVPSPDETRRPISVSAGVAYFQTQSRFDGQSGVSWNLGEAFQYRVSADVGLRSGSLGLAGTLAYVPINRGGDPNSDGDIQFRQLLATFRSPEASGFHQVIEIGVGLAQWANYSGTDVLTAEEGEPRNALALVIGYGFAFPMGDRFALSLVQDYGTVIGSAEGLPSGTRRSQQQFTTRVGLRWRVAGGSR